MKKLKERRGINEKFILNTFYILVAAGFLGIGITVTTYCIWGHINIWTDIDHKKIDAFGSFIGGFLGTLFSIAAILLIWLTYVSQKEELRKTNVLATKQTENLELQQFESTFFNMLALFIQLPDTVRGNLPRIGINRSDKRYIDRGNNGHIIKTKEALQRLYFEEASNALILYMEEELLNNDTVINGETVQLVYDRFYSQFLTELDHYFRYFYNILKFVDQSRIENKSRYIDLLQAQLSKYELCLIYYNGLGSIGKPKLFPLLEKYNVLENINEDVVFRKDDIHYRLYPQTTFRFLPKEDKVERITQAIQNDVNGISPKFIEERYEYYFQKYNCSEEVRRIVQAELKRNI